MNAKERAALAAADLVRDGMLLGLGTGSTATLIVREIGRRLREGSLRDLRGIPTSRAIETEAERAGIPLLRFDEAAVCDLTLDGADEVDPAWNLIKGGGGSLLREKIVAQASRVEAIVVDDSKLVPRLGERFPLPVEVVPFGWASHLEHIRSLGGEPKLRTAKDGGPFITDEGNFTLDVAFHGHPGATHDILDDPARLDRALRRRAGIVETGFFLGLASILVIGRENGAEVLRPEIGGAPG